MSVILLASGGLDSTVLAFWLKNKGIDFVPVFINYGQHCADTEYETLKSVLPDELIPKIEFIDISSIYIGSESRMINPANLWEDNIVAEDLYLPYRNLMILSVGAIIAHKKK